MNNNRHINPTYKSGIKTLNSTQINNGLPGYDLLKSKIEIIREKAVGIDNLEENLFENLKYDNIFSILGGRGAGKTSILFTLYDYLKNDSEQSKNINILMPLIMPELIDNSDNFIGWILAAMEQNLIDIENKIIEKGYCDDSSEYGRICKDHNFFERCVFNKRNGLRKAYEELKKAYYSKQYGNRIDEQDYSADLELISGSTAKGFALVNKFMRYWNMLVKTYKGYMSKQNNGKEMKEPLIFIMIDDADLKPQIINELIFGLPKFFSHPNVVVIISASQKILNYTVKNFMFQQITKSEFNLTGLMDIEYKHNYRDKYNNDNDDDGIRKLRFHELRYGREYDKIKNLTEEILRKLFPVCNRFYLKKYDRYEDKGRLRFENNDGDILPISKEFANIIRDFKDNVIKIHKLYMPESFPEYDCGTIIDAKQKNFKLLNSEQNDISNPVYLSFLGIYPRDIVSNYYTLHDILLELKHELETNYQNINRSIDRSDYEEIENEFISQVYNTCINFIHSIITSNRNLKPFCRESYDLILKQKLQYKLYVNYEMINNVMCEKEFFANNKENPDYFLEMFSLLNFIEQLIVLVIPERKVSHGYAEFKIFLDKCDIKIVKQSEDLDKMLIQYYWFQSSNILHFNISNDLHRDVFLKLVEELGLFTPKNIRQILIENKNWYHLYMDVIFYKYSNISIVEKNKNEFFIFEDAEFIDSAYEEICKKYYSILRKWFTGSFLKKKKGCAINEDTIYFIDEFSAVAFDLNEYLNNIKIYFCDEKDLKEELDSYAYELSQAEGLFELKRSFFDFTEKLEENKYTLNRLYIVQVLKNMRQLIILDDYADFPYILSWYRRFKFRLKQNIIFKYDPNYEKYDEACEYINKYMTDYIDCLTSYYSKYFQTPDANNSLKSLMKKHYFNVYISNLFEREWLRLRGLE